MIAAHKGREIEWEARYVDFTRLVAYTVTEDGGVACRYRDRVRLGEEVVVDVATQFCGERQEATVRVDRWGACGRPWGILDAHLEAKC